MTTTLVKGPIRTSPSMIAGPVPSAAPAADAGEQPLAYHYATWTDFVGTSAPTEQGHYDADRQVWVAPPGVITAGHKTGCWYEPAPGAPIYMTDDACH